jgi:hypothetical protein
MTDATKVGVAHLQRAAYVYLRQSTPHQVEHNRESTEQQYGLVSKDGELLKLGITVSQATVSRYMPASHGGRRVADMARIRTEPSYRDRPQSDFRRALLD